ncbi:MAG: M24 family metallopeptidase [Ignavibacteria bacterium]|nr:M24 family metallopeptidase [Ignavibacteria bacterium]
MEAFNLEKIQSIIRQRKLDGWLLYDFRASNSLALEILKMSPASHLTRRFFYFIPANGVPTKIVNGIEAHNLSHLPGKECKYSSKESLHGFLDAILKPGMTVAMEYSPKNAIPYLSKVDAGTYEYLKDFGITIVSSGDLITLFTAIWSEEQYQENLATAKALPEIIRNAFGFIKARLTESGKTTEYEVQQYITNQLTEYKLITDFPPIVSVNENAANPHYGPDENTFKEILPGDFVLIDLWAKPDNTWSVWSDITWVGYCGTEVPEKYTKIFTIVKNARDAALELITSRFAEGKEIKAFEADEITRKVITDAGYGEYFIHRTGHSITTEVHGSGPHLDNFETHDERVLLPSTSCSIEPGIYLPGDFGVRSEIDVYIHPDGHVIYTGGIKQEEVVAILA